MFAWKVGLAQARTWTKIRTTDERPGCDLEMVGASHPTVKLAVLELALIKSFASRNAHRNQQ